jgi:hypothetical protein
VIQFQPVADIAYRFFTLGRQRDDMRFPTLLTAIVLFASGCSERIYHVGPDVFSSNRIVKIPSNATRIGLDASVYRRLTGRKLRQAIVGTSMFIDPESGIVVSGDGQYFLSDGHRSWHNRDLVGPVSGTYSVTHDLICSRVKNSSSWCFALFRSQGGKFLIHSFRDHSAPTPVLLNPNTRFESAK